jgi:hypothetical protein
MRAHWPRIRCHAKRYPPGSHAASSPTTHRCRASTRSRRGDVTARRETGRTGFTACRDVDEGIAPPRARGRRRDHAPRHPAVRLSLDPAARVITSTPIHGGRVGRELHYDDDSRVVDASRYSDHALDPRVGAPDLLHESSASCRPSTGRISRLGECDSRLPGPRRRRAGCRA